MVSDSYSPELKKALALRLEKEAFFGKTMPLIRKGLNSSKEGFNMIGRVSKGVGSDFLGGIKSLTGPGALTSLKNKARAAAKNPYASGVTALGNLQSSKYYEPLAEIGQQMLT